MDRAELLGRSKLLPLILKFSVPAITGMLIQALYGVVGGIFVGRGVGAMAISGISVSMPLIFIVMAIGMLSALGATTLVSLRLGENRKEDAEKILANALTLTLSLGALTTVIGIIFLHPILKAFGATGESLDYSSQYMSIIFLGSIFQMTFFTLNNCIRAEGNPSMALSTFIVGFIVFTLLAGLFIFPLKLGIRGAALASVLSQVATAVWSLFYFTDRRSHLHLKWSNMRPNFNTMKLIIKIGTPAFAMQVCTSLFIIVFNHGLATYGGNQAIAAMGIGFTIYNLILMPIIGINQGMQPILGFNYGARQYDRVKKTLLLGTLTATFLCITGWFGIQFFERPLFSLFIKNDETIINIGTHGLKVFMFMLPLVGFQIIGSGYFQAVGKHKHALFLGLSRQLIFLIPLLLTLSYFFQLEGIWYSGPIADSLAAIATGILLLRELSHINRKHAENQVQPVFND